MVNDVVVSVKMPRNMILDLKEMASENHYLDLSEQIRDIIREKTLKKILDYQKAQAPERSDKDKIIQELLRVVEELKK